MHRLVVGEVFEVQLAQCNYQKEAFYFSSDWAKKQSCSETGGISSHIYNLEKPYIWDLKMSGKTVLGEKPVNREAVFGV